LTRDFDFDPNPDSDPEYRLSTIEFQVNITLIIRPTE